MCFECLSIIFYLCLSEVFLMILICFKGVPGCALCAECHGVLGASGHLTAGHVLRHLDQGGLILIADQTGAQIAIATNSPGVDGSIFSQCQSVICTAANGSYPTSELDSNWYM